MKKIVLIILFLPLLFMPRIATADVDAYGVYVHLGWAHFNYESVYYSPVLEAPDGCLPTKCYRDLSGISASQTYTTLTMSRNSVGCSGTWYVGYAGPDTAHLVTSAYVIITAHKSITVNGESLVAGDVRTFNITGSDYDLDACSGSLNTAIIIDVPPYCDATTPCPGPTQKCIVKNIGTLDIPINVDAVETTTYNCENNACVPDVTITETCDPYSPDDLYMCGDQVPKYNNPYLILRKFTYGVCHEADGVASCENGVEEFRQDYGFDDFGKTDLSKPLPPPCDATVLYDDEASFRCQGNSVYKKGSNEVCNDKIVNGASKLPEEPCIVNDVWNLDHSCSTDTTIGTKCGGPPPLPPECALCTTDACRQILGCNVSSAVWLGIQHGFCEGCEEATNLGPEGLINCVGKCWVRQYLPNIPNAVPQDYCTACTDPALFATQGHCQNDGKPCNNIGQKGDPCINQQGETFVCLPPPVLLKNYTDCQGNEFGAAQCSTSIEYGMPVACPSTQTITATSGCCTLTIDVGGCTDLPTGASCGGIKVTPDCSKCGDDGGDDDDDDDKPHCNIYNRCDSNQKTGVLCSVSGSRINPDAICQNSEYRCTLDGKCSTSGTLMPCDPKEGCAAEKFRCTTDNKCARGAFGKDCTNPDGSANPSICTAPGTTCDTMTNECVEGGDGASCSSIADCQPYTCNQLKQCVPNGGSSIICTIEDGVPDATICDDSDAHYICTALNTCDLSYFTDDAISCEDANGGPLPERCVSDELARCDTVNHKCVETGGDGKVCQETLDGGLNDLVCQGDPSGFCDDWDRCTLEGMGKPCASNLICEASEYRCNEFFQCVLGGPETGRACSQYQPLACLGYPTCDVYDRCLVGGGLERCDGDYVCGTTIPGTCDEVGRCVEEDTGGVTCDLLGEQFPAICRNTPSGCTKDKRCVPGGGPTFCRDDSWCQELMFACAPNGQCMLGGPGDPCQNPDGTFNECQPYDNGQPVVSNLSVDGGGYCTGMLGGMPVFSWEYTSPDNVSQAMYELQVFLDSGEGFDESNLLIDRIITGSSFASGNRVSSTFYVFPISFNYEGESLNYGTNYYWRVKSWDELGGVSEWSDLQTYTYEYPHPAPSVIYNIPASVAKGQPAYFSDISRCYFDGSGTDYACSGTNPNSNEKNDYGWWFMDPNKSSPDQTTVGSVNYTYSSPRSYASKLQVCDEIGCCSASKNINIKSTNSAELPGWREIAPTF
jgi:hypothetical protein